jgi:hypothetical protein
MKILSLTAELFHADGRTDMTKLIVAFRNFAIAPKTVLSCWLSTDQSAYTQLLVTNHSISIYTIIYQPLNQHIHNYCLPTAQSTYTQLFVINRSISIHTIIGHQPLNQHTQNYWLSTA